MKTGFEVIKEFEDAVADYTGANHCVAVNSCTNAIALCLEFLKDHTYTNTISIPRHTYVSVPMQIKRAGLKVIFRDEFWSGVYKLQPLPIFDAARRFTSRMCLDIYDTYDEIAVYYICTSHHWNKILGLGHGGCILTNDVKASVWFRAMRHDGRIDGLPIKAENILTLGMHCPMMPEIAAQGLVRLASLPRNNPDLPNSDYPDLSTFEVFK